MGGPSILLLLGFGVDLYVLVFNDVLVDVTWLFSAGVIKTSYWFGT
jgi:hypothetical protein